MSDQDDWREAARQTTLAGVELADATIPQLQQHLAEGRFTAEQLTSFHLDRIALLNPRLNAVITVSPTAVADARQADAARQAGDRRPLLGVPVLVKDNIATTGMPTTAGSLAMTDHAPADASVTTALRAAGAVILGKANLSEWANFRSTHSTSGWSAVGGQTRNPHVLDRNPCGSSSGSAVAVAACLATVAIGTETDGSIVCPAGLTGVVGVKPTLGLVSRTGIVPISPEQDTAGPMARTVTDAAMVLTALAGVDAGDPATAAQHGQAGDDYAALLDADALRGARLGVWRRGITGISPATDRILAGALQRMAGLGAELVDPVELDAEPIAEPEFTALQYEFRHALDAYLAASGPGAPAGLAELIAFNEAHAADELRWFGQDIFEAAAAAGPLTDPQYLEARRTATDLARRALDSALAEHRLDAIVTVTNSPAWPTDLVNGDRVQVTSSTPAAVAGYPAVTVPAGDVHGLPVGLTLIGAAWSEARLLALAYAWEQATSARRPPRYLPTLG